MVGDTNVRVVVPLITFFMEYEFQTHLAGLGWDAHQRLKSFNHLSFYARSQSFIFAEIWQKRAFYF